MSSKSINLKGTTCPLNFVKTKLALEKMAPGELLEVTLDLGEPEKNVPMSLETDGFRVVGVSTENDYCVVKVENKK